MKRSLIPLIAVLLLLSISGCMPAREDANTEPNALIWALEAQYDCADSFSSGVAGVLLADGTQTIITKSGEQAFTTKFTLSTGEYYDLPTFTYGIAMVGVDDTLQRRVFTRSGVVANAFAANGSYTGASGCLIPAADKISGKAGYQNLQNLWYIYPEYLFTYAFSDGYSVAVTSQSGEVLVSETGAVTELSADTLTQVKSFSEGYGVACVPNYLNPDLTYYYYIDTTGKPAIPGQFRNAGAFCGGLAPVKLATGLWGYINTDGEVIIDAQYTDAKPFSDGLAAVFDDEGRRGFVDYDGNLIIDFRENSCFGSESFESGVCVIADKSYSCGLIDMTGQVILEPEYDAVEINDRYCKLEKSGEYGVYIPDADVLISPKYRSISAEGDDILLLSDKNRTVILNVNTGEVVDRGYYQIERYSEGLFRARVSKDGLWGYIDTEGQWVIQPQFTTVRPFSEGLAAVELNGKWGYIANPLVYDAWEADEVKRGEMLGLYPADSGTSGSVLLQDMLQPAAGIMSHFSGTEISPDMVSEALGLKDCGVTQLDQTATRETASIIAARVADYCGQEVYCLSAFLLDEGEVSPEALHYVSYAASFGLFDLEEPGRFQPNRTVEHSEMQIMMTRLFEACLDEYERRTTTDAVDTKEAT